MPDGAAMGKGKDHVGLACLVPCGSSCQSLLPKKSSLLLIRGSGNTEVLHCVKETQGMQLMLASCYYRGVCSQGGMICLCLSQGSEGMNMYL